MIGSLLTKLGMLALTMGVLLWIGWTTPQEETSQRERAMGEIQTPPVERIEVPTGTPIASVTRPASRTPGQPQATPRSRADASLDLNRATQQDFESLPGIGPVLAGRIVEYRRGIGSFRRVEDLREIQGIGKKKFDRIRKLVHVTMPKQPARGEKTT